MKKILGRLFQNGNSTVVQDGFVSLRAFGKLPNYLEYQHLEDSSGLARDFQEWVAGGHQHWVQVVPAQERGEVRTTDVMGYVGENQSEVVVARLWQSRDSANPPRRFPFTFFVVIPAECWCEEPADQLIRSSRLWASLQIAYDRQHLIYERGGTFQRFYRDQKVGIEFQDTPAEVEKIQNSAKSIPLRAWLETIVPACRAKDGEKLLDVLKRLVRGWKACEGSQPMSAIRLPLSPLFRAEVQGAAWMRWLEVNLNRRLEVLGILVNQSSRGKPEYLTVLTHSLQTEDFLLATENAAGCDSTEDVSRLAPPDEDTPREGEPPGDPLIDNLLRNEYSLWDWAGMSMAANGAPPGGSP